MRSPIYPFEFNPTSHALVTTMGLHWVLCAPRKAHGPRIVAIADAKDFRVDDDYYYFGFESEEARADANERVLVRIDEIRAEGRKKPHALIVDGVPGGQSIRWLTLATGTFHSDTTSMVPVDGGEKLSVLIYPFDTAEEVERTMTRVRARPEFTPEMRLGHWQADEELVRAVVDSQVRGVIQ